MFCSLPWYAVSVAWGEAAGKRAMSPLKRFIAAGCMLLAASGFLHPALVSTTLRTTPSTQKGLEPRLCSCSSRRSATSPAMAAPIVKRVAIVGAGVGGLTLANALCKGGMAVQEVKVFEKFECVRPGIGGGVQINSGAVVLARLLGSDVVKAGGNRVERILGRTVGGRVILDLDVVEMVRSSAKRSAVMIDDGTPMVFTIMRDRLMQILARGLPDGVVRTRCEVTAVEQSPEGATLRFRDGSSEGPFDLVVGADGIKGVARKAVRAEEGSDNGAIYSGIRIQYGVAPSGQRPKGCEREVHQWFGRDTYGLSATYRGVGDEKFDMVAVVYQDRDRKEENAVWELSEAKEACLRRLEEKGFPPEMKAQAEASERFFELGVYYRNPLEDWVSKGEGQVILLGDAAHAMPPNLGQGANQAIQDAYCLAERVTELNRGGHGGRLLDALRDYERRRKPETTAVLAKSAFVGAVETLGGPIGEALRDNFFFGLWKGGVAERVYIDGAMPKV